MVSAAHRPRLSRLLRPFKRLAEDGSAVSAVEFALILPLMLTLYIGGNEFGHALTISRKVTHVASTVSDLVAQSKTLTNADMGNILDAAESVMTPYPATNLKIKVSLLAINNTGKVTVVWSDANENDTPLTVGQEVQVPVDIIQNNTHLVVAEVHHDYTPMIGYVLTGTFDLWDRFYLRPRLVEKIKRI